MIVTIDQNVDVIYQLDDYEADIESPIVVLECRDDVSLHQRDNVISIRADSIPDVIKVLRDAHKRAKARAEEGDA